MNAQQIMYGVSLLLASLVAGLFYGYQCSVNNGLGALSAKEYLAGFQSINRHIINPTFMLSFMGSLIVLPIATYLSFKSGSGLIFPCVLTATILYVVGVFGVTIFYNVPLNEMLDRFDLQNATETQLQTMRESFEISWNRWHVIRTMASVACVISLIIPLIKKI